MPLFYSFRSIIATPRCGNFPDSKVVRTIETGCSLSGRRDAWISVRPNAWAEQAGVHVTWLKLHEAGIHGNGHMMMLEKNNVEVAAPMSRWMDQKIALAAHSKNTKGD